MTPRLSSLLKRVGMYSPELEAELRDELDKPCVLWPDGLAEVVAELVSPSVWNPDSRTYKTLDREIVWVVGHWLDRHGPFNDAQREYCAAVLIQAVKKAVAEAGGDKKKLYPYLKTEIRSRMNNDRVADGFKRRHTALVDVNDELERLVAA